MSREDIAEYIRMNMYTESEEHDEQSIDYCQNCGTTDSSELNLIEQIPEHGGEIKRTVFCDEQCKSSFIESLK